MHTEAHLFSVPNDCLWYDKLWGPSQRVVTLFINAPYLPILSKANFLYTSHRSLYNPDKPGIEQGKVKHRECYMYECLSCKSIPFVINFTAIIKIKSLDPSFKVYISHHRLRCGLTCFPWTCLFPGFRLMTVIQLAIAI